MNIKECIDILGNAGLITAIGISGEGMTEIADLEYNSKKVKENDLFFCKGTAFKPEYLEEAVGKGICCFVSDKMLKEEYEDRVSRIIVTDIRKAMSVLSKAFYYPEKTEMKFIGITGTKGKSTTVYILKTILNEYLSERGLGNCAFVSGIEIDDGKHVEDSTITTPEAVDLYRHIANAAKIGSKYIIIETSSQALKTGRCDGIRYDTGAFLNISDDHISPVEHPDFEDYFNSKIKIFDVSDNIWLNSEDEYYDELSAYAKKRCSVNTYGINENDRIRLIKTEEDILSQTITLEIRGRVYNFVLSMGGIFNAWNAMCAIGIADECGVPANTIKKALTKVSVPGRMKTLASKDESIIFIVDYAHNKVSYKNIFEYVKNVYPDRKVAALISCNGGKAYNRRKDTGIAASLYCDSVYIVPNNSGKEDFMSISREIVSNMNPLPKVVKTLDTRGKGIKEALKDAEQSEDKWVILSLTKGNQHFQRCGTEVIEIETDAAIIKRELAKLDK